MPGAIKPARPPRTSAACPVPPVPRLLSAPASCREPACTLPAHAAALLFGRCSDPSLFGRARACRVV